MAIHLARDALGRVFFQRCFYLFALLLALIAVIPFVEPTPRGRILVGAIGSFIVVAAVAAVGRSLFSFVLALLLAIPLLWSHYQANAGGDPRLLVVSWFLYAALFGTTIVYLLRYVFRPDVMTTDKLYGAAAAYLLIGVLWAYVYALVDHYYPGSFSVGGQPVPLAVADLLYFSFTTLTSTGFGDITPALRPSRGVCVVEQLTGTLFLAILIARLAGVYPPRRGGRSDGDDARRSTGTS